MVAATNAVPEQVLQFAPRIALVIGNGDYAKSWDQLRLSANDATAMAETLKEAGFQLVGDGAQFNVGVVRFQQLIDETAATARAHPGAIVSFYFSGHGFAYQGRNMLAPVDASRASIADAAATSIDVDDVARSLSGAGSTLTMLFLDACREAFDVTIGFADTTPLPGTFIGFGAYFGTAALEDESDKNSKYTAGLLKALHSHWDTLGDFHVGVASMVSANTNFEQIPVYRADPGIAASEAHIALVDPESNYARLSENDASSNLSQNSALLGARCASLGTMGILDSQLQDMRTVFPSGGITVQLGRASPPEALAACEDAYTAGARDPATVRAYGLALIANAQNKAKDKAFADAIIKANALMVEAAENGDGTAETFLALIEAGVIKLGDAPQDLNFARQHILHAVEQGQTPISTIVGLQLISDRTPIWPNREFFGLDRDPATGFKIIVHAAREYDPFAVEILATHLTKELGYESPVNIREILRSALGHMPVFGAFGAFALPRMTIGETLYYLAMADALTGQFGPPDWLTFVQLAVVSEPSFQEVLTVSKSGVPATLVGCALVGGIQVGDDRHLLVISRDEVMAKQFFRMAIEMGGNEARDYSKALVSGEATPCASNWIRHR
jgi:hypothetical protein